MNAEEMLAAEWGKVYGPKGRGGYCPQTFGAPVGASDPAALGRGHAECWDGCGLSLRVSLERWSWESCSGRSYHLEFTSTRQNMSVNKRKKVKH